MLELFCADLPYELPYFESETHVRDVQIEEQVREIGHEESPLHFRFWRTRAWTRSLRVQVWKLPLRMEELRSLQESSPSRTRGPRWMMDGFPLKADNQVYAIDGMVAVFDQLGFCRDHGLHLFWILQRICVYL